MQETKAINETYNTDENISTFMLIVYKEKNRGVILEQSFLEAKIISFEGSLKNTQETAKYWEQKYYARLKENVEVRNLEKLREIVKCKTTI